MSRFLDFAHPSGRSELRSSNLHAAFSNFGVDLSEGQFETLFERRCKHGSRTYRSWWYDGANFGSFLGCVRMNCRSDDGIETQPKDSEQKSVSYTTRSDLMHSEVWIICSLFLVQNRESAGQHFYAETRERNVSAFSIQLYWRAAEKKKEEKENW